MANSPPTLTLPLEGGGEGGGEIAMPFGFEMTVKKLDVFALAGISRGRGKNYEKG